MIARKIYKLFIHSNYYFDLLGVPCGPGFTLQVLVAPDGATAGFPLQSLTHHIPAVVTLISSAGISNTNHPALVKAIQKKFN